MNIIDIDFIIKNKLILGSLIEFIFNDTEKLSQIKDDLLIDYKLTIQNKLKLYEHCFKLINKALNIIFTSEEDEYNSTTILLANEQYFGDEFLKNF